MNIYERFIELINTNLIHCIIPIIITLIIVDFSFKKRFETKKVLHLVCWFIVIYSVITLSYTLIGMIFNTEKFATTQRATESYGWAYWTMSFSHLILPFTLLYKKIASNFYYVMFVAVFMKIGFYYELFVIIVTSFHRDYRENIQSIEFINSFTSILIMLFIQGIIIALILLGIFEILKKRDFRIKAL